jgi:outer membrane protein OmpA-like peptidoglycan-associated protein
MKNRNLAIVTAAAGLLFANAAIAQTPASVPNSQAATLSPSTDQAASGPAASKGPASLEIYFDVGSSIIRPKEISTLDEASRIFNDGKPIVMIVTGMADSTGTPAANLLLSQKRADIVFAGLVARGLPANHFQILAKGASETLSGAQPNGGDPHFRKVEITWR